MKMDVKDNIIYLFGIFLLGVFFIQGLNASPINVCGTEVNEPWMIVNNSLGDEVLIVDGDGDMYVRGTPNPISNPSINESEETIQVGDLYFADSESYVNTVNEEVGFIGGTNGLLIKDAGGNNVAFMDDLGIDLKGQAIFQHSQANCTDDGYYCNGTTLDHRDYFCDISGVKAGTCTYEVDLNESCLTRLSAETDLGVDYENAGSVDDYLGCDSSLPVGSQNCSYNRVNDYCENSNNLKEFFSTGFGVSNITKNCRDLNSFYCDADGITRKQIVYGCDGPGECSVTNPGKYIETCVAPPTSVSWGCSGSDRVKTTVTYDPLCSTTDNISICAPSGVVSNTDTETVACSGAQVCSSGSCVNPTNLALGRYSHSWTYNSHLNPHGNWHGLTSGVIPSNSGEKQTGVMWASASGSTSWYDKWVSVDLAGGVRTVTSVKIYDEHSPNAGRLCGGAQDNTKDILIYTKSSGSCAWNSGGWTYRATYRAPAGAYTGGSIDLGGIAASCVRLKFDNTWSRWRSCNCWDCHNYVFLRELQVFGY